MQNFVVYEINFEHLIGFSIFSNISLTATNNRKQNEHAIHIQDYLYIAKSIYRLEDFEGVIKE
jgi:hypothetical protein